VVNLANARIVHKRPTESRVSIIFTGILRRAKKEWGNGVLMDASDRDGADDEDPDEKGRINLQEWPTVKGMYMPDTVKTFKAKADGGRCELDR